jgi:hypothetical protein
MTDVSPGDPAAENTDTDQDQGTQEQPGSGRHERASQQAGEGERAEFDSDAPLTIPVGYVEDAEYRPSPFYQYGTYRTDGVGGDTALGVNDISPAFQEHRARSVRHAARALDPNDVAVAPDNVVLPDGGVRSTEQAEENVRAMARHYIENPVPVGAGARFGLLEATPLPEGDADTESESATPEG